MIPLIKYSVVFFFPLFHKPISYITIYLSIYATVSDFLKARLEKIRVFCLSFFQRESQFSDNLRIRKRKIGTKEQKAIAGD